MLGAAGPPASRHPDARLPAVASRAAHLRCRGPRQLLVCIGQQRSVGSDPLSPRRTGRSDRNRGDTRQLPSGDSRVGASGAAGRRAPQNQSGSLNESTARGAPFSQRTSVAVSGRGRSGSPHAGRPSPGRTEHLRNDARVRHDDDAPVRRRLRDTGQTGEHASAKLRVGLAPWPRERIVDLRHVPRPQVREVPLQVRERSALHLAAVDLARPVCRTWRDAPDSPQRFSHFCRSLQCAGEERVRNVRARTSSEQGVKISPSGWRQRKIQRPAQARSRVDRGVPNQHQTSGHDRFSRTVTSSRDSADAIVAHEISSTHPHRQRIATERLTPGGRRPLRVHVQMRFVAVA
jgi:hypothetical protein